MLSFINKPSMLNVIMLKVIMLSVTIKLIMLSVIMLNVVSVSVVMLNAVAPPMSAIFNILSSQKMQGLNAVDDICH